MLDSGFPLVLALVLFSTTLWFWQSARAHKARYELERDLRMREREKFVAEWARRSEMPDWRWREADDPWILRVRGQVVLTDDTLELERKLQERKE